MGNYGHERESYQQESLQEKNSGHNSEKKIASPEEIAGPILFLASELSDNVVGEILNVNGGSVLCG